MTMDRAILNKKKEICRLLEQIEEATSRMVYSSSEAEREISRTAIVTASNQIEVLARSIRLDATQFFEGR